jgi:hypothetical protein
LVIENQNPNQVLLAAGISRASAGVVKRRSNRRVLAKYQTIFDDGIVLCVVQRAGASFVVNFWSSRADSSALRAR